MPAISVIVPVYKVEKFLPRCVDSILNQRFSDFELILVDDGSPDGCGQLCENYAAQDGRIHVIHQENGGLSAARNTGIDWAFANSDSRWLAFVDSDDWVHPEYLHVLYQTAEQTLCKLSVCGLYRTAGEPLPDLEPEAPLCLDAEEYYCGPYHEGLTAVAWNKLYHKSLFKNLRYPIGKLHEDEFTTYQAVYAAGKVGLSRARLYAYYQNPDGITHAKWNPRRMDMLEAFEQQIAFAKGRNSRRLLEKCAQQYLYASYEQLNQAPVVYRKELRRKLRSALKLGRELGCTSLRQQQWAYEAAYPCKPVWYLVSRAGKGGTG